MSRRWAGELKAVMMPSFISPPMPLSLSLSLARSLARSPCFSIRGWRISRICVAFPSRARIPRSFLHTAYERSKAEQRGAYAPRSLVSREMNAREDARPAKVGGCCVEIRRHNGQYWRTYTRETHEREREDERTTDESRRGQACEKVGHVGGTLTFTDAVWIPARIPRTTRDTARARESTYPRVSKREQP